MATRSEKSGVQRLRKAVRERQRESTPGRGTVFTVRLPVSAPDGQTETERP